MQASTTGGKPATCKSFEALLGMEIEEKMNVVVEWAKLRSAAEAEADTDTKKPRYEVGTEIIKSFGGDAYRGKIVAYDPVENYYHVRYEDSDSEDMEEKEIGLYLSQANTPTAQIPIAQGKGKKQIFKRWAGEHNDFCVTCDDSGDLLCCEFCANVQHATCLDPSLTESDLAFDFVCQQCMLDICLLHDND